MPDAARATIRVLYIDDDMVLARLVARGLGRQGFQVQHAATLEDATALLGERAFDVVALDHYLPGALGLDYLPELSKRSGMPPIVYVTGSSDLDIAVAALTSGAADFVPKTVGDDFLVLMEAALRQAVEKAKLRGEKELAETEVRKARDRAEALLAEVNHRVANSLALVASMVSMQARAVDSDAARAVLAETEARISAIALVHRHLYTSPDVSAVDLHDYLSALVHHLRVSLQAAGHGATLLCDLEAVSLATDQAISLGVITTEWVTNAFKYAYPASKGEVRVRLKRLEGAIELAVEDDGVGRTAPAASVGTGLGSRMVRAMATTIGAQVVYEPGHPGTTARLTLAEAGNQPTAASSPMSERVA
jgi:two-component sensor histidine kinase